MIKPSQNLSIDQKKLKRFCQKNNIDLLILHGSYSTGNVTKESDIDIGILMRGHLTREKYWKILGKLTEMVGERADCVLLNDAETMISYQTATQGTPLYERRRGLFDEFTTTAVSRYQDAAKFRKLEKEYLGSRIKKWSQAHGPH